MLNDLGKNTSSELRVFPWWFSDNFFLYDKQTKSCIGFFPDGSVISIIVLIQVTSIIVIGENKFFFLWYVSQTCKGVAEGEVVKRSRRPRIRMGNLIDLTTFRRNGTTMEVTILKKTRTTRMTRIMGRVTVSDVLYTVYSENGDRITVSTSQHKQWRGYIRRRVV